MSGEPDHPADGADGAQGPSDVVGASPTGPQTRSETTVLLARPANAERESSLTSSTQESDFPRLPPGESIARRFTILRFIAEGGMGTVYEANDVKLRSRVALKVIRGRIATDAPALERFRREVLLARRISHPNVCRVYELYDATTTAGVPIHFLTMELLEGETLSQRILRQGRLTTAEALPLVRQLCEGLTAAHAEGVIHRDFKSSNVMLVPRGRASGESTAPSTRVAITDFGIARAAQAGAEETGSGQLTGGAGLLGTPAYMAPEQVSGGEATPATDIYALGVVLYEIVTGKLPFTGATALAVATKRLNEAPPHPEATTPGLDARWSAALLRCLAREPERRFKSAMDILPELERHPRRWPRLASINGLVLAGALVALALVLFVTIPPLNPLRSTLPAANLAHEALPAAPSQLEPKVPVPPPAAPSGKRVAPPASVPPTARPKQALPRNAVSTGPPGTLVLNVRPWGEVFIDSKSHGEQVGRAEYELPPGTHQVEVKGPSSWGPKQILIESEKTFSQAVSLK